MRRVVVRDARTVEIGQRCAVPTPLLAEVYRGLQTLGLAKGIYQPRNPLSAEADPAGRSADRIKAALAARLVAVTAG